MFTVWVEEYGETRDVMTTSSEKQAEKFCDELNAKFERKYGRDNEESPLAYISCIDDYAFLGEERIPYVVDFNDDGTTDAEVGELGICWFQKLARGGVCNGNRAYVMAWDKEHALELGKERRRKYELKIKCSKEDES